MLTSHPSIVMPPECGFAVWWYEKYRAWTAAADRLAVLHEFWSDVLRSRKFDTWHLDAQELWRFLDEGTPRSYGEAVSLVYECYGVSRGRSFRRWGDKNNFHLEHISTIKDIFPDAHFVHIVRDGRDVACSYRELNARRISSPYAPRLADGVGEIAREWSSNIELAVASFDAIGWENTCEVTFEQLVTDTVSVLTDICTCIGEEYSPLMLDYHRVNREEELEPKEFLQWKERTLSPPQVAALGRFRKDLTPTDQGIFERLAGKALERYRYL